MKSQSFLAGVGVAWFTLLSLGSYAADIKGRITANGKTPVSGAIVRLLAPEEKQAFITITNGRGAYGFDDVPQGKKHLEIEKDGQIIFQDFLEIGNSTIAKNIDLQTVEFPVALHRRPTGDLFILDQRKGTDGRVVIVRERQPFGLSFRASFNLAGGVNWSDMVPVSFGGKEFVFVVGQSSVAGQPRHGGMIEQVTVPGGQVFRKWPLPVACDGIAVDEVNGRVFVSSSLAKEIYLLDFQSGKPRFLVDMFPAKDPAVLTIDVSHQKLYVGDRSSGDLYVVDINNHSRNKVAEDLGHPNALTLDQFGKTLYVCDGSNRRIRLLKIGENRSTVFSKRTEFQSPTGFDIGGNGSFWLSDSNAHAVFQLNGNGAIVNRYSYF